MKTVYSCVKSSIFIFQDIPIFTRELWLGTGSISKSYIKPVLTVWTFPFKEHRSINPTSILLTRRVLRSMLVLSIGARLDSTNWSCPFFLFLLFCLFRNTGIISFLFPLVNVPSVLQKKWTIPKDGASVAVGMKARALRNRFPILLLLLPRLSCTGWCFLHVSHRHQWSYLIFYKRVRKKERTHEKDSVAASGRLGHTSIAIPLRCFEILIK